MYSFLILEVLGILCLNSIFFFKLLISFADSIIAIYSKLSPDINFSSIPKLILPVAFGSTHVFTLKSLLNRFSCTSFKLQPSGSIIFMSESFFNPVISFLPVFTKPPLSTKTSSDISFSSYVSLNLGNTLCKPFPTLYELIEK